MTKLKETKQPANQILATDKKALKKALEFLNQDEKTVIKEQLEDKIEKFAIQAEKQSGLCKSKAEDLTVDLKAVLRDKKCLNKDKEKVNYNLEGSFEDYIRRITAITAKQQELEETEASLKEKIAEEKEMSEMYQELKEMLLA